MNLIFDRTAEDVQAARKQRGKVLTPLKGCYNATDMNRVAAAVKALAAELNSAGYKVEITPRTFAESDIIRRAQWAQYLENVQRLREAYYTLAETGELPKPEDKLGYQGANTIEKVLADIDLLVGCMKSSYRRCGTFAAGQTILPRKG